MSPISPLMPRQSVPDLSLNLADGGTWKLRESGAENFTLMIFYRGWHCPVCRKQLMDAQARIASFAERGVKLIAISVDGEDRALEMLNEGDIKELPVAYGLTLQEAREWGLYISTSRGLTSVGVEETHQFSEPGIFMVRPDMTLYYASVQTAPFARPPLAELENSLDFILKNDYPARGEVVSVG